MYKWIQLIFLPFILSPSRHHRKSIFEKHRIKKYNIHSDCCVTKRTERTEDEKKIRDNKNNQHIFDTEFMRRRNLIRSNNKWKYEQKIRGVKEYKWANSLHKKYPKSAKFISFVSFALYFTCIFSNIEWNWYFCAIDDAIAILKMIISSEPYVVCCICINLYFRLNEVYVAHVFRFFCDYCE